MDTSTNFKTLEKDLNELAERVASADIDPTSRIALQKAAQKLSLALETTGDSFQRIAFLVGPFHSISLLLRKLVTDHAARSHCNRQSSGSDSI